MILWALATMGLTHIIVESPMFKWLREYGKPFTCYQCFGFWSGIICSALNYPTNWILIPVYGFAGSFLCVVSATTLEWMGKYEPKG